MQTIYTHDYKPVPANIINYLGTRTCISSKTKNKGEGLREQRNKVRQNLENIRQLNRSKSENRIKQIGQIFIFQPNVPKVSLKGQISKRICNDGIGGQRKKKIRW